MPEEILVLAKISLEIFQNQQEFRKNYAMQKKDHKLKQLSFHLFYPIEQ